MRWPKSSPAVWLLLAVGAAALLRRVSVPRAGVQRLALPVFGTGALVGAILLFQHYFVGPFYTIPQ